MNGWRTNTELRSQRDDIIAPTTSALMPQKPTAGNLRVTMKGSNYSRLQWLDEIDFALTTDIRWWWVDQIFESRNTYLRSNNQRIERWEVVKEKDRAAKPNLGRLERTSRCLPNTDFHYIRIHEWPIAPSKARRWRSCPITTRNTMAHVTLLLHVAPSRRCTDLTGKKNSHRSFGI